MDWKFAIDKQCEALAVIIAGLIAMVGQGGTVSRPFHRTICRILRPAESALRRLIVVVAANLRRKAQEAETAAEVTKKPLPDFSKFSRREGRSAFVLIDPRKRFCGLARPFGAGSPRISLPGLSDAARPVKPDDEQQAKSLCRRIDRLEKALKTLPRQARRLNRLMLRRAKAKPGPGRVGPIRPGHPPGSKKRPVHPVDDVLRDCHGLAISLRPP